MMSVMSRGSFYLPLFVILLAGCATTRVEPVAISPEGQQEEIPIDEGVRRSSQAMHAFLVGELSLRDEKLSEALVHFERAGQLETGDAPELRDALSELLVRKGDLNGALLEVARARRADPDDFELVLREAGLLEVLNRPDEALAAYQAVWEKQRDDYRALMFGAWLGAQRGNADLVTEMLLERRQAETIDVYEIATLAQLAAIAGAESESIRVLRAVVKIDPHERLYLILARLLVAAGNNHEARRVAAEALQHEPDEFRRVFAQIADGAVVLDPTLKEVPSRREYRHQVAQALLYRGEPRAAIAEYELLLGAYPTFHDARYQLAALYAGTGRQRDALRELGKIPRESPGFVDSRVLASMLYRQRGELSQAITAIENALAVAPRNPELILHLAHIHRERKDLSRAERIIRAALQEAPEFTRAQFLLAQLLDERGALSDAIREAERLVRRTPDDPDALHLLARLLLQQGVSHEQRRAEMLVDEALALRPTDGSFLLTKGLLVFGRGGVDEAESILIQAFRHGGDNPESGEALAAVLLKQGERERAREVLRATLLRADDQRDTPRVRAARKRVEGMLRGLGDDSGVLP